MKPFPTTTSKFNPVARVMAFSLVELMIATAIMVVIFAALFTGISSTFTLIGAARENLRATQIAVSRLEGLRLCAWSGDQLFNTNIVPPEFKDSFYPLGLNSTTNYGIEYSGTINVTTNFTLNPPATYAKKMALITISVTWTNQHGKTKSIHTRFMNTYAAQFGIQNYVSAQ